MLISGSKCRESGPYIEKDFLKYPSDEISRNGASVMGTDFQNETFPHLSKSANHFKIE